MVRTLWFFLCAAGILYLVVCLGLFSLQRSLIYAPQPGLGDEPTRILTLSNQGEHVLVSTRPKDSRKALVYFGGNAEDTYLSLPSLSAAFSDSAIYLMHYRGYGGSSGTPSEKALFADALALFDEVYANHSEVDVVGRSLGSGVAVYLASRRPASRLVLVTPFDSLQEIAANQFPFVPVRWLLADKFESWRYAPQVSAPTLIIAAEHDEVVPRASTDLLQSRFKAGIATFQIVPNTGHNTISNSSAYLPLLRGSR